MAAVFIESDGKYTPVVDEFSDWKTVSEARENCATVELMMDLDWQDYSYVGSYEETEKLNFYLKNDGTLMLVIQYISDPSIELSKDEELIAAAFLSPTRLPNE